MAWDLRRSSAWCGIVGGGLVVAGCMASALLFHREGYGYSIFGCFISELGDVVHAPGHALFNGGLVLGAAPLLVFMFGLGQQFRGALARLAGATPALLPALHDLLGRAIHCRGDTRR